MNQSFASARNTTIIPRLATLDDESTNNNNNMSWLNNETMISRNLSTSGRANQAAPLLTPKAPKMSSELREARAELPPKPKRPITAWLAFLLERKDDYLKNGPMKANELTLALSKEWRLIDKSRYEREFEQRKEIYRDAMESYKSLLTDEQHAVIKLERKLAKENKAMKALRATKPPVLPRNPANLYCIERCKDPHVREQLKVKKSAFVLRDLFAEYRNLSESEKERFLELQQKDRLRFQQEFTQWHSRIQSDSSLSKTAHEKADLLHARFKALNWI